MRRLSSVIVLTAVLAVLVSAANADPSVRLDGYQDLGSGQYQYSYLVDNTTGSISLDQFFLGNISNLIGAPDKLNWSTIPNPGDPGDVFWASVDPDADAVPAGGALGEFDIITGTPLGDGGTSDWALIHSGPVDDGISTVFTGSVDNTNVTPEASTWALLLSSTGLLGLVRRRRKRSAAAA